MASSDIKTGYVKGLGNAEQVTFGSNETAVTGCVGNSVEGANKNIQRGGYHYGFEKGVEAVHAGGPTGGVAPFVGKSNCGISSDTNLNASAQSSNTDLVQKGGNSGSGYGRLAEGGVRYGFTEQSAQDAHILRGSYIPIESANKPVCSNQVGGSRICHDLRKVKHFRNVQAFWTAICPGAVMIYEKHLNKHEEKHSKKVLDIVKLYTKAFCHEVRALSSRNKRVVKRELSSLKSNLAKAGKLLNKLSPKGQPIHKKVEDLHIGNISKYIEKVIGGMKYTKKHNKKNSKKHVSKKNKTNKKRKSMKGGYSQFGANVPNTPSYSVSTNGGWKLGTPGAALNKNCDNCTDNYNHFSGKGSATGVFDKDVSA